jgi:DNA-directed RNA polymerase specialized sigma24 family protein
MSSTTGIHDINERYRYPVYRRCRFLLRDDLAARDVTYDVLAEIIVRNQRSGANKLPLTAVVALATSRSLRLLGSHKAIWRQRYGDFVAQARASAQEPGKTVGRENLVGALTGLVDHPALNAALHRYVDAMSLEEAASACGCTVPELQVRLDRFVEEARKRLKMIDVEAILAETSGGDTGGHLTTFALERYQTNDLANEERSALVRHLERCNSCQASLAQLTQSIDEFRRVFPYAEFVTALAQRDQDRRAQKGRRRSLLIGVIALLVACVVALGVMRGTAFWREPHMARPPARHNVPAGPVQPRAH